MHPDDLHYFPLEPGLAWIHSAEAERVLIRGELDAHQALVIEALNADIRQLPPAHRSEGLHNGVYGALRRGRWEALVVTGEMESVTSTTARPRTATPTW